MPRADLERPYISMDDELRGQLPSWLTLAGYAIIHLANRVGLTSFHVSAHFVYQTLAWYTLAWAGLAAVDRSPQFDLTATAVGPVWLAANYLGFFGSRISPFETAAALFGVFWIDQLPKFEYSRWVWLATLAASVYQGISAQWLVAAFGLSAAWRLVEQARGGGRVRIQDPAFLALAAFAFYKHAEVSVALTMMLAQMAASLVFKRT